MAALIDGIVTPAEREAVQAHLRVCKPCRTLLEDLQRLSAASASEAVPPPPSDLAARIRWRLQSLEAGRMEQPRRPSHRRWLSPLPLSAAAGLVLAFVALWMLRDEVVPERGGTGVAMEPALPPAQEPQPGQTPPAPAPSTPPAQKVATEAGAPKSGGEAKLAVPAAPRAAEGRAQEASTSPPMARKAALADETRAPGPDDARRDFELAEGVGVERVTGAPAPGRVGRRLSLERPDLRIEVDEGGALSVDSERYSCVVQVQPAEVAHLFLLASPQDLSALGDLATVPEGIDPTLAQRGRRVLTRTGGRGEGFQAIEYLDLPERPAPSLLREIEVRLLQIVRSDARERLEKACGPLSAP
jgi:hypothetical protein